MVILLFKVICGLMIGWLFLILFILIINGLLVIKMVDIFLGEFFNLIIMLKSILFGLSVILILLLL